MQVIAYFSPVRLSNNANTSSMRKVVEKSGGCVDVGVCGVGGVWVCVCGWWACVYECNIFVKLPSLPFSGMNDGVCVERCLRGCLGYSWRHGLHLAFLAILFLN